MWEPPSVRLAQSTASKPLAKVSIHAQNASRQYTFE
jgi:hypothetical protein